MRSLSGWVVTLAAGVWLLACGAPGPVCDATNCGGCCDERGVCQPTNHSTCGRAGALCQDCSRRGQFCGPSGTCGAAGPGGGGGGGGGGSGRCSVADDCPRYSCTCADGTVWNARRCENGACSGRDAACAYACEGRNPIPKAFGCTLSAYSNEFRTYVEYYGASGSETAAKNAAIAQCRAANFTEAFCASGTLRCSQEALAHHDCTFSKYSNDNRRWVTYYGEGSPQTAGRASAVDRCLAGAWRGWFCGSGSITCSRQN